jgi:hypothetical protein
MFKGLITAPANGYSMITLQDAWTQAITNSEIHKTHTKETKRFRHPTLNTYINALGFENIVNADVLYSFTG